jgi:hypothetical protein
MDEHCGAEYLSGENKKTCYKISQGSNKEADSTDGELSCNSLN